MTNINNPSVKGFLCIRTDDQNNLLAADPKPGVSNPGETKEAFRNFIRQQWQTVAVNDKIPHDLLLLLELEDPTKLNYFRGKSLQQYATRIDALVSKGECRVVEAKSIYQVGVEKYNQMKKERELTARLSGKDEQVRRKMPKMK